MIKEQDYKIQLLSYIASFITLTELEKASITDAYSLTTVKKKAFLFEQGKACSLEAFVVDGSFRVFYIDHKGFEHVLYFAFKNWWAGDIASFNSGEPSNLIIQALEDSTVLTIDFKKKEQLLEQVPKLEKLFRIIAQNHLTVLQKRFLLTISSNAANRYQELIERHPGIEQLVPQHQIASYLGIRAESLSRMKNQMHKEKAEINSKN